MMMRVRGDMSATGMAASFRKATNSVKTIFTPSSQPPVAASFHGTPISQASGVKTKPRPRSTVSGWPPTAGKLLRMALARATRATMTTRMAAIFITTIMPSAVPLETASMALSYFSDELYSTFSCWRLINSGTMIRASKTPAGAETMAAARM